MSYRPDCCTICLTTLQITGDDTPALQAVLDADVWRKVLLREQSVGHFPSRRVCPH